MRKIRKSKGDRISFDRDGDADESRPQTSLLLANEGRVRQQQNFWLHRSALMAFSFLFFSCALALVGVSWQTTRQNGLPLSLSSSRYSWTYGPTGVLVIILALWRQVDYHCRSMQPWWEMVQGPSTAARSILLDYISPFQPLVCVSALKNGHYAPFTSTLAFLVLKLVILLSTTLFVVEPTWHLEPVSFHYHNTFNSETMWNSPEDALSVASEDVLRLSRQGDASIWSYIATLNNATAMAQGGTKSRNLAHQSLSPPGSSANISSVSGIVDVFVPSVSCEEASLSLPRTTFTSDDRHLHYRVTSPSCSSGDLKAIELVCENPCNNTKRFYSVSPVNCASHNSLNNKRSAEVPETDIRYAITMADLSMTFRGSRYESVSIKGASAIICEVGYGIVSANSTRDTMSGQTTLNENLVLEGPTRHLPNLTNHDLAEILLANLNVASATLLVDSSIEKDELSLDGFSLFQLLAVQLKLKKKKVDNLLEPSLLITLSVATFEGIATEFAKKALLVKGSGGKPFEAVGRVVENRLHLRHYTLWPMVSGFFLLSVCSVVLSLIVPAEKSQFGVTGSIASHACVLVNSPSLLAALEHTGHCRSSHLKSRLENMHFTISPSRSRLRIEAFGSTREALHPNGHRKKRPWLPLPVTLPMVALTFILPLLTILLLEVLQRLSDKRHGLLDLDNSTSATLSYAVRLASTLLAFIIATLFNNLDFSMAVFTPYSTLRSGTASAQRSVLFHLLGVSPFLVLVDTFRLRQFGSAASNLSTLLGSFLSIIVSGLWVIGNPVDGSSVSIAMVQKWDREWLTNNHDDRSAAITLNVIRHGGATTPRSIQGYDVLPKISLDTTAFFNRASNTYETTVLRPVLDCHSVPQEEILIMSSLDMGGAMAMMDDGMRPDFLRVTVEHTVPSGCSTNSSGRGDTGNLAANFEISDNTRDMSEQYRRGGFWVGQYLDLESTPGLSDAACPSAAIVFGKVERNTGSGFELRGNDFTALFCSQKIEEIPATITYKGNPSNINLDNIKLHSENAKYWVNGTSNSTNMAFKLKGFLESGLSTFPRTTYLDVLTGDYYDKFFNHVFFGPQAISPTDAFGPSNTGALTEAITRAFKEYFAHIIDLNFRLEDSETSKQGTTLRKTNRLAIDTVSKIILQSLLAATTVLSFVGYSLVKIRGTLPRNPCSIASTMGFLADSQLCDPKSGILPKEASLMNERELRQSLHGFVFSLGWWERSRDSNGSRPSSPSGEESSVLDAGDQQEVSDNTYFGIDVGRTNALGFSKKEL